MVVFESLEHSVRQVTTGMAKTRGIFLAALCLTYFVGLHGQNPISNNGCLFSDVESRTVVADAIFQGQMTSLPVHLNQVKTSTDSELVPLADDTDSGLIAMSVFRVVKVIKGQLTSNEVQVLFKVNNSRICTEFNSNTQEHTIEDPGSDVDVGVSELGDVDTVIGMNYIIFLNISRAISNVNTSAVTNSSSVYWALGNLEYHSVKTQRRVVSLACQHCGKFIHSYNP